jgi:hypothetical protein
MNRGGGTVDFVVTLGALSVLVVAAPPLVERALDLVGVLLVAGSGMAVSRRVARGTALLISNGFRRMQRRVSSTCGGVPRPLLPLPRPSLWGGASES